MARHRGGSIFPSNTPAIMHVESGRKGHLQVRDLGEVLDTHGLFYERLPHEYEPAPPFRLIASHPNGYSCHELSKRLQAAWEQPGAKEPVECVIAQAEYILACGGLTVDLQRLREIAQTDEEA